MFSRYKKFGEIGVLGINKRNADYILKYNPRSLYPFVDDKLQTKKLASNAGIATPKLYGVVEEQGQVRKVPDFLRKFNDFVIKPAQGSGGDGILVFSGRSSKKFRKVDGKFLEDDEIKYHVANILGGMYSLGGHPDKALIEYRVRMDPIFEPVSYQGIPDIRIIVFLGFPVMSMVRLPTRLSDGKANLHQGAIGAGINLKTGKTMTAVFQDEIITEHPDTGVSTSDIQIPNWDALLRLAVYCYDLIGLGYIGVDIALDRNSGPMILEINARPGLNIQIANCAPLLPRLLLIEKEHKNITDSEERIQFAKNNF